MCGGILVSSQVLQPLRGLWFLLLLLPGACGGSSSDGCEDIPMCQYAVNTVHLESGEVEWAIDGTLVQSASVVSSGQATGDCELVVSSGRIGAPANPPGVQDTALSFTIVCGLAGNGPAHLDAGVATPYWSIMLSYVADPRSWVAGQVAFVEASGGEFCAQLRANSSPDTLVGNWLMLGPDNLSVLVEEAVGGAADPPAAVTADYRRVFRVEYTTRGRWLRDSTTCEESGVSVKLSLEFSQNASDFFVERQKCYICR